MTTFPVKSYMIGSLTIPSKAKSVVTLPVIGSIIFGLLNGPVTVSFFINLLNGVGFDVVPGLNVKWVPFESFKTK
ncbi:MAG: hypothetical protein BWX90_00991 [bacterium ADurb.Bin132]|nr:MAG: hypothetical protein BWX90_00991 [bacterium ADurb.Bin132]